jgi:hypothetical protein
MLPYLVLVFKIELDRFCQNRKNHISFVDFINPVSNPSLRSTPLYLSLLPIFGGPCSVTNILKPYPSSPLSVVRYVDQSEQFNRFDMWTIY